MRRLAERDVIVEYRNRGVEKGSIYCIVAMAEHITVIHQQINELTATVSKLIDMMGGVAGGYNELRRQVERIRGKDQDDDLPHKTE